MTGPTDLPMTFDYRVAARNVPNAGGDYSEQFFVIDCYYNAAGEIVGWSEVGTPVGDDDPGDLAAELDKMRAALCKPILLESALPRDGGSGA